MLISLTNATGNSNMTYMKTPMDFMDIVGKRFGKLTVEKFLRRELYKKLYLGKKHFVYYYLCRCDCGQGIEVVRTNLMAGGHTTSCGCLKRRVGKNNPCWKGHGDISSRHWNVIKVHAQNRGLILNITLEDAWGQFQKQQGLCALTGIPLTLESPAHGYKYKEKRTASLDRIDSTRGYEKDNIQWVHKTINRMKMNLPQRIFIEMCYAVTAYEEKIHAS